MGSSKAVHSSRTRGTAVLRGLPRVILAGLLLAAILNLLAGVFLRYVMVRVSDWFDLPSVNFFWVEEVGEFTLAWLSLIGAAVGISEGVHFTIGTFTHHLPRKVRTILHRTLYSLVAGFGVAAAISGGLLGLSNRGLDSPGLGINLGLLYMSALVGGVLIAAYGIGSALAPPRAVHDLSERAE
jgi:TRAP-type C4-dicarboxylate transport system permease small subunit